MKWLGKVGVVAAFVSLAGVAMAGDYHSGLNLKCNDCHIMHYSYTHDYAGVYGGNTPPGPGSGGPFTYLLKDEINALCLSCHDGNSSYPDVMDANTGKNYGGSYGQAADVRSAGYLNSTDATFGTVGLEYTGHTMGTGRTAPGGTWTPGADGLVCTDCHAQHGYAGGTLDNTYRNLRNDPSGGHAGSTGTAAVSYLTTGPTTPSNTVAVNQFAARDYREDAMEWMEPDQNASAIAQWCGECHPTFHGTIASTNIGGDIGAGPGGAFYDQFERHPVAGQDIGAVGGGHSSLSQFQGGTAQVKVMGSTFDRTTDTTVTATCISCHKAHGNGNPFGLIYRARTDALADIDEDGSTNGIQLENMCGQCHVQASSFD